MPRIVSLLPAATEWICAFGAEGDLVGRSHACDAPPGVEPLPVLTKPTVEVDADAADVDRSVREHLDDGLALFDVDVDRLRALEPDIIVTQDQCDVCAVSRDRLDVLVREEIGDGTDVFSFAPLTLKQVFDRALRLGRTIGRLDEAMRCIAIGEKQLRRLMQRLGIRPDGSLEQSSRPSVMCIEWMEPPMVAGHWTPDVLEKAGGRSALGRAGEPSHYITWDQVHAADPDVIAFMPCGFGIGRVRENLHYALEQPVWPELRAVRENRVYLFDGSAYFNRPGPRLYRSIELLARVLHPTRVDRLEPPVRAWEAAVYPSSTEATPL